MHILTVSAQVPVVGGRVLQPGSSYYFTTMTAGSVLLDNQPILCPDGRQRPLSSIAHITPAQDIPIKPGRSYNGRSIYLFRAGGYGDLMFLGPSIRALKAKWPKCRVVVVCSAEYADSLLGHPCEVIPMPLATSEVQEGDAAIFFENVIEHNPEAEKIHAVDLFAQKIGIEIRDRSLEWLITEEELDASLLKYPVSRKKRVGIQVAASSPVRSYHPALLTIVAQKLLELGHEVFLFGKPGQLTVNIPGSVNLSEVGLSMRESVALLSSMDVMLTPDSALLHAAQAIGVQTVALFGSFPSELRITDPSKVVVLEAAGGCAPCFHHSSQAFLVPQHRPCSHAGFCTVVSSITPETIILTIQGLLDGLKAT